MVYTIDILCPEHNEVPGDEVPRAHTEEKPICDRTKVTRLQVINLRGQVVDIEH